VAQVQTVFDLTVIGGGPGGYVAAIRSAQLGLRTALVEKDPLPGGTCLHVGCIPTKALLHTADLLESARDAGKFGIQIGSVSLDLPAVHAYRTAVVQKNARGVEFLLKKNKVETIKGFGKLAGRETVLVQGDSGEPVKISSRNIILATGSSVRSLPGVTIDGKTIISSDEALTLPKVPASMIVLGGGAVGVEFASIWSRFGSQVTVVELLPRLLPVEDEDISAELERCFRKRKITVHTGTKVESVTKTGGGVELVAKAGEKEVRLSAEVLLVAVGRKPRTEGIGLEGTKVVLEKGFVKVDGLMRTGEPGVYAIGDIVPTPALAHVASHEGIIAAEQIAGKKPHPIDPDQIPGCTYSDPEVASVGLAEAEAKKRGLVVKTGKFPFSALGKASILQKPEGFVKIVFEAKYDQVLGVHMIGPHVTDLIAEAVTALKLESTVEELHAAVHPHPTLSESVMEAAMAAHGQPIHIFIEAARAAGAKVGA